MAILHLTLTWSALTNVIQNATTFLQQIASPQPQPQLNAAGGTPSALGFFSVVSHLNDFSEVLLTYIDVVNRVQSWIGLEIRPVIKHAAHFSRNGCLDASETFINFAHLWTKSRCSTADWISPRRVFSMRLSHIHSKRFGYKSDLQLICCCARISQQYIAGTVWFCGRT